MRTDTRTRLDQALQLCQSGAFERAEHMYRDILDADAGNADGWNMLALVLHQLGRFAEAAPMAVRATTLRPGIAPYWLTRGNLALALGEFADAQQSLLRATQLAPGLAQAHHQLGLCHLACRRFSDAIAAFGAALRHAPDVAEIHYRLAEALMQEGRWDAAMQSFEAAFVRDPAGSLERHPCVVCMKYLQFRSLPDFWHVELLRFFQRNDINRARHGDVGLRALKAKPAIRRALDALTSAALPDVAAMPDLRTAMGDGLFQLLLREAVLPDAELEHFLTHLRSALLQDDGFRSQTPLAFICALAMQCFNNEFAYAESAGETAAAELLQGRVEVMLQSGAAPPDMREVALLALYRPIHDLPNLDRPATGVSDPVLAALLKRLVTNVLDERSGRSRIESIGTIRDQTSRAVRDMYEENPYPRWFSVDRFAPASLEQWMSDLPLTATPHDAGNVVNILVAGCGTGKEACELAANIAGAQVLAVDLSLSSLAYAQRMAGELGITNIRFRRADILALGVLDTQFDLISSSGVLHHMQNPEAGLRVLAQRLRPGGVLRVALYSERARADVNAARAAVKERKLQPDPSTIRAFRQQVYGLPPDAPISGLIRLMDFYSLSTCRDLVFHVMEHQYRLPQIDTMLRNAGLMPVDLAEGLEPHVAIDYRRRFPDDPAMTSIGNWDLFEESRPETFVNMFSIRCRKPAKGEIATPNPTTRSKQ